MTPAEYIVFHFTSIRETARVCGLHHTSVRRWLQPKMQGGTGGIIPSDHHTKILKAAQKRGLPITSDNLVYGNRIPRVTARRSKS